MNVYTFIYHIYIIYMIYIIYIYIYISYILQLKSQCGFPIILILKGVMIF